MRFKVTLQPCYGKVEIPISYHYPLSATIYKILEKGDKEFALFLHERGYGKGFKMFCFSDLQLKFRLNGDRMQILSETVSFEISLYLPEASQNFIKGLFLSQNIDIADRKSRGSFTVQSVEALPNPFAGKKDNEVIQVDFQPASAVVAGLKNEMGNYTFLSPEDPRFTEVLLYNWKEKIKTVFPDEHLEETTLDIKILEHQTPPKSRLITVKAGTREETKVRGYTNFSIKALGEKKFVEVLWGCGMGLYNSAIGGGFLK